MADEPDNTGRSPPPPRARRPGGRPLPENGDRQRAMRLNLAFALLILLAVLFLSRIAADVTGPQTVPYSRFLHDLDREEVTAVAISPQEVVWTVGVGEEAARYHAVRVPGVDDAELVARLHELGVEFSGETRSEWWPLALLWILPSVLLIAVWIWIFRRITHGGRSQAMSFGQSRAKVWDESSSQITFEDVAGVEEAVEELKEVVDFLRKPDRYVQMGARIPKGVLLVGPTGTGKTLLARATAGEAGVPFFTISGAEFVEMFVGVGAARVRDLFRQARERAPCIVFIDEIDTLGKTRAGPGSPVSHEEREQTLNQLLVEVDGFDPAGGVILMAATNRPDLLDPALSRPGRFDRQITVDRPDHRGRESILRIHARKVKLDPEVDLRVVAARTPGFAGAQLANVVNEAALLAVRRGREQVTMRDMDDAIDRVMAGLERTSRALIEREQEIVAHHEMGHALVGILLPRSDPVHKVSIVPRGTAALGVTIQTPLADRYLLTEGELRDRLAVILGGRAAEEVVFGETSTGAADDLLRATELARRMVTQFGMTEGVGPLGLEQPEAVFLGSPFSGVRAYSEETARRVDAEIRRLVEESYRRALELLQAHEAALRTLASELRDQEVMEGAHVARRLEELGVPVEDKRELAPMNTLEPQPSAGPPAHGG